MKALPIITLSIFLTASPSFCGVAALSLVGRLLTQADQVVVATVRNSSSAEHTLNIDLIVGRAIKGSAIVGSSISATLSSPNVRALTPGTVQTSGAVVARELEGKTGLWFLQTSGSSSTVLSLVLGDLSTEDLYIPVPPGQLPAAYLYDSGADPKTKLVMEIGAAAEDPATVLAISRLAAQRMLVDLDPDLRPVFNQLASSPRAASRAIGWAGQIRLGTPSVLTEVARSKLGSSTADAQSQLANSVCMYRSTDAGGIAALGDLVSSQYPDAMRFCATYALREIHSKDTLPFLEKLLDDNSAQIRFDAVIGIAQYAISFPMVSMAEKPASIATFTPPPSVTNEMRQHYPAQSLFLSNEQEYISYWKAWLAAHPVQ